MEFMGFSDILIFSVLLIGNILCGFTFFKKLRWVLLEKGINDEPCNRSSHLRPTPTAGGIYFYFSLVFSIFYLKVFYTFPHGTLLIVCLSTLLLIGVLDDLISVKPRVKLFAQFVIAFLIMFLYQFHSFNLHGAFNIFEFHYLLTYLFIVFFIIGYINAFNLIDGIDGLAGFYAILAFSSLSIIFLLNADYFNFGLCMAGIGALISFLRFNLSKTTKLFMGDTGSLVLGFLITYFCIDILYTARMPSSLIAKSNVIFLLFSILFLPVFDTFRVMTIRLLEKRNVFKADRNHIHHLLIDKYHFSHLKATLTICSYNLLYITLNFVMMELYQWRVLVIVNFIFVLATLLLINRLKKNKSGFYQ